MKAKIILVLFLMIAILTVLNSCDFFSKLFGAVEQIIKITGKIIVDNAAISAFQSLLLGNNFNIVIGIISQTFNSYSDLLLKNFKDYFDYSVVENLVVGVQNSVNYILDNVQTGKYFLRVFADFNKDGIQQSTEPSINWPDFNEFKDFQEDTTVPDLILSTQTN